MAEEEDVTLDLDVVRVIKTQGTEIEQAVYRYRNSWIKAREKEQRAHYNDTQKLVKALTSAVARLEDMLMGDDGQAWDEAGKVLPGLKEVLEGKTLTSPPTEWSEIDPADMWDEIQAIRKLTDNDGTQSPRDSVRAVIEELAEYKKPKVVDHEVQEAVWRREKTQLGPELWTISEAVTYRGFFLRGWDAYQRYLTGVKV